MGNHPTPSGHEIWRLNGHDKLKLQISNQLDLSLKANFLVCLNCYSGCEGIGIPEAEQVQAC